MLRSFGSVTLLALLMVGCGGGSGGSASSQPPPAATYTVGGTVTGLSGSGLELHSDFGGDLPVSASGSFTFGTRLPVGSTFNVGVKTQPTSSPAQHCQVANGTGTIAAANVTTVDVTCTSGYTIRGNVSGLQGAGLVLQIAVPGTRGHPGHNVGPPVPITSNGPFTIVESAPTDSNALVAFVSQQPASPYQPCLLRNAIDFQAGNVTGVEVACSQYAYVTNAGDNTVSAYTIDPASGVLAPVGTPVATGMSPHAIVGAYDRRYVFVANEGSNDISAFTVNFLSGELTPVPGSPFAAGTDPQGMAVSGSTLYVANAGSDNVSAYTIDATVAGSGVLTALPGSPVPVGKHPTSIAVDSVHGTVVVANHGGSNDISAFYSDLTPVPGSPFPAGGNPLSLQFGGGFNLLYSANPDATNSSVSGFSFDPATGKLSLLSGSPFPLPVSHYMAIEQTGIQTGGTSSPIHGYLYVTTDASIVGYAFDWTTGALTALPGFPVPAGANAYSITIDPTNQFLYVANDGAANISGFKLDALTGALTPMVGSPFPGGNHPKFIATF